MNILAAKIRDNLDRYGRFQLVASDLPWLSEMFAALDERDRLRELLARCQAHMLLAAVPGLRSLVPNPLVNEIAAALAQPTETTNSKEPPR